MVLVKDKRNNILDPLSAVSGIIERRHTLPILSNVLIERTTQALSFLATDIEIQITARSGLIAGGDPRAVTVGARKLVDIDYHIAMGGRAYASLADTMSRGKARVLGQVFSELSQNFQPMVDALNEVSETSYSHSDKDILRLYEVWLKTGSRRCYDILKRLGVEPTAAGGTTFAH